MKMHFFRFDTDDLDLMTRKDRDHFLWYLADHLYHLSFAVKLLLYLIFIGLFRTSTVECCRSYQCLCSQGNDPDDVSSTCEHCDCAEEHSSLEASPPGGVDRNNPNNSDGSHSPTTDYSHLPHCPHNHVTSNHVIRRDTTVWRQQHWMTSQQLGVTSQFLLTEENFVKQIVTSWTPSDVILWISAKHDAAITWLCVKSVCRGLYEGFSRMVSPVAVFCTNQIWTKKPPKFCRSFPDVEPETHNDGNGIGQKRTHQCVFDLLNQNPLVLWFPHTIWKLAQLEGISWKKILKLSGDDCIFLTISERWITDNTM